VQWTVEFQRCSTHHIGNVPALLSVLSWLSCVCFLFPPHCSCFGFLRWRSVLYVPLRQELPLLEVIVE
jgi:hypothetical protein